MRASARALLLVRACARVVVDAVLFLLKLTLTPILERHLVARAFTGTHSQI